jgi:anti-sigma factor RsiW
VDCREAQDLMHAYADHELDLVRTLDIERHIHDCRLCAQAHQNIAALRTSVGNAGFYFNAPPGLEQRIRTALRDAQPRRAQSHAAEPDSAQLRRAWRLFPRLWVPLAAAASVALVAVILWAVLRGSHPSDERLLAQAVVSGHVRSLMAEHLLDVPSTDRHTVKPWFDGKLDFAPDVRDFRTDSFPLIGGRLDYLADRPVAALVYRHDKHYVNLFMWPAPNEGDHPQAAVVQQGYQLIHWVRGHMNYWAVSDMSPQTLQRFAELLMKDQGGAVVQPK